MIQVVAHKSHLFIDNKDCINGPTSKVCLYYTVYIHNYNRPKQKKRCMHLMNENKEPIKHHTWIELHSIFKLKRKKNPKNSITHSNLRIRPSENTGADFTLAPYQMVGRVPSIHSIYVSYGRGWFIHALSPQKNRRLVLCAAPNIRIPELAQSQFLWIKTIFSISLY